MWIDSDRRVAFTTDGSYDTEAEPAYLSGEMFTVLPDYDNRLYVYCLGISPSTGKPVVLRGGGGVTVYQYVVSRYSGAR